MVGKIPHRSVSPPNFFADRRTTPMTSLISVSSFSETITLKGKRRQVGFEVKLTDLGRQPRVFCRFDNLHRQRRGMIRGIDQKHLLLGADPHHAGFHHSVGKHFF
jgi:hypothetical protein